MPSDPHQDESLSRVLPDAAVPVDADRPVEISDDGGGDVPVPLEAPIEAPVDDLIDQRRSVPLDDPDER